MGQSFALEVKLCEFPIYSPSDLFFFIQVFPTQRCRGITGWNCQMWIQRRSFCICLREFPHSNHRVSHTLSFHSSLAFSFVTFNWNTKFNSSFSLSLNAIFILLCYRLGCLMGEWPEKRCLFGIWTIERISRAYSYCQIGYLFCCYWNVFFII